MRRSPVRLSILREIGWSKWDPIGLSDHTSQADEYDAYLLSVAGQIESGKPDQVLVDQLMQIEADHMGLGPVPTARERAEATVAAIRKYVESLDQA